MKTWSRMTSLGGPPRSQYRETWEYRDAGSETVSFDVDVTIGKPLDVLGLKGASLDETREFSRFLQRSADVLYAPGVARREVSNCPCCEAETDRAAVAISVFGVQYKQCWQCGHAFVGAQPAPEALSEVFAESEEYAALYTDTDSLELRLAQVVTPKLDWVLEAFRTHRGREPHSVLDVGAGGGHFVEVCRRTGLRAEGYEMSTPSRRFASEVFDIQLLDQDFLQAGAADGFDVITFWGLLEYTPEPKGFLHAAHKVLESSGGMLVVEVPRFDCLGTAVQREYPSTVARHMDPTSHMNCFTDESLATALLLTGFGPVAAWYYGLDVYEVLIQLALNLNDHEFMRNMAQIIPGLQASLDSAKLCDDLIVAAFPRQ